MNENKINGMPASADQVGRVIFLQEKKRRIQAEAKLLVYEERQVDAEIEGIIAAIEAANVKSKEDKPSSLMEAKEGAA